MFAIRPGVGIVSNDDKGLGGFQLNLGTDAGELPTPKSNDPFFITILGDFSGRASREICEPQFADRALHAVDCDDVDVVLKRVKPSLMLPGLDEPITFESLDDFHPDRLYNDVPVFAKLRRLRKDLQDPDRFKDAAAQILGPDAENESTSSTAEPAPAAEPGEGGSWLDAAIEATDDSQAERQKPKGLFADLLNDIVGPHLVPSPDPRQEELIAAVDEAMSAQMHALLHHPLFEELESNWRGIDWLTRRVELDGKLKVAILDVSKKELLNSFIDVDSLQSTSLYRRIESATLGTERLSEGLAAMIGCYSFGSTDEDVAVLAQVGKIASKVRAPLIAAAHDSLVGVKSIRKQKDPDDWSPNEEAAATFLALCTIPESSYICLTYPRVLARLPYGKLTEPVDRFGFEEIQGETPESSDFLWSTGGFAVALTMARNYQEDGWKQRVGGQSEVSGLPMHTYKAMGQAEQTPTAEAWLGERAVEALLGLGLTPLVSRFGEDAIQLFGPRAISVASSQLQGRWPT